MTLKARAGADTSARAGSREWSGKDGVDDGGSNPRQQVFALVPRRAIVFWPVKSVDRSSCGRVDGRTSFRDHSGLGLGWSSFGLGLGLGSIGAGLGLGSGEGLGSG